MRESPESPVGMATKWHSFDRVPTHDSAMEHEDRLIGVHELAAYLAVPVKTLYAWRYRREGPPAFRVGRYLRYRWSDVQWWIQRRVEAGSLGPGVVGPK